MAQNYLTVTQIIVDHSSTSTAAVSALQDIAAASHVTFIFKRSQHSSGSTAYTVDVSADGTVWVAYNKLIDNVTNTNAQNLVRLTTKTLSSNTQDTVSLDTTTDAFRFVRVTSTIATDGHSDVWLLVQRLD